MLELLKQDLKPRDIMTYKAFENALVTVMALGGSTNAVLHFIAMARYAYSRVWVWVREGVSTSACLWVWMWVVVPVCVCLVSA